jgi:hypothetical protein
LKKICELQMDINIISKTGIRIKDFMNLNKLLYNLSILNKQFAEVNEENKDIVSIINIILICLVVK